MSLNIGVLDQIQQRAPVNRMMQMYVDVAQVHFVLTGRIGVLLLCARLNFKLHYSFIHVSK